MAKLNPLFLISASMMFTGCVTLEQRLAKRVGCDDKKLIINKTLNVPAYSEYRFTCEGRNYVCRDAPFHSSCNPDKGDGSEPAAEKPKK